MGYGRCRESVQVKFLKNATPTGVKGGKLKATYTATADENGQWSLTLPAMKPGGALHPSSK